MGEVKRLWLEKNKCTGCGVCVNTCPHLAIDMKLDKSGFYYPVIKENCVNCGLCEKKCLERNQLEPNSPKKVFAAWSKNKENRFYSTSGGVFGEIAKKIIDDGGYVVGAAYDDNCDVEHVMVHSLDDIVRIQQSKYAQSASNNIFIETRKILSQGNKVLFCGTPCQIAGLKAFLNKEYDNLYLVDFICRGVNSPKAYKAWIREIEESANAKVCKVWFKYKVGGWRSSPKRTRIDFCNGESKVFEGEKNLFMTGYLGPNLYIRPSCGNCDFKGENRYSDITLADFWGIEKKYDDNKGTSMVMINSDKGINLWEAFSENLVAIEKEINDIIYGNPSFRTSVAINNNSQSFLETLDELPFSVALKKYYKRPNLIIDIILRITKKIKSMI